MEKVKEITHGEDKNSTSMLDSTKDFTKEAAKVYEDKVEEAEEEKGKEYKDIKEFLDDPEQQAKARVLAIEVMETVSRNWFDMTRYMRKTRRGNSEASFQLGLLREFEHLVIKGAGSKQHYKVVFDTLDEQKLIQDELVALELRKKMLKADLRRLKKKQKLCQVKRT